MSAVDETDHVANKKNTETTSVGLRQEDDVTESNDKTSQNKGKNWVKFEEDDNKGDNNAAAQENPRTSPLASPTSPSSSSATATATTPSTAPASMKTSPDIAPAAVLTTETVHVNIDYRLPNSPKHQQQLANSNINKTSQPAVIEIPIMPATMPANAPVPALRTIELSSGRVREGFANGDVIVTLLPINTKWPWITPAIFRPELVPEELMAQGLTLTVEEYVHAMETLVNDVRFTLYNICYKRVLVCWIMFAFCVLLGLLFSGLTGITLFSMGVGWLFLNAAAIFLCMWVKLRLARGLERCMARVNKQLIRHKIILALDDRGHISCHKVNLCFMYFEPSQCVAYLNDFIERSEQNGNTIEPGWESRLDVAANDIVIQGSRTTRLSRKQERGHLIFIRYASRWGNEVLRGFADVSNYEPARHCQKYQCPCQFIERHLKCKPRGYPCKCCFYMADPNYQYSY